jgi:hypothetical protein
MARFAEGTKVPVEKTRMEIEGTLKRFGASHFAYFTEPAKAVVAFRANERNIRFDLPLPTRDQIRSQDRLDRSHREKWRALLLAIKAKLSSVESKIETFEEAFYSHVVMPDGRTLYQHTSERVESIYKGEDIPLLPAPGKAA